MIRTLLKVALAVAAVTIVVATVSAQPKKIEEPPRTGDERFEVRITDEMVRHSRLRDVLYFVGTAWTFGTLAVLLLTPLSRRMRDAAERVSKKPFVAAMAYIALFVLATTLLELPLVYYSDFVVPHQFDLTEQSLGGWTADLLKGVGVSILISMPVGALTLLAIRRFRRWWLAVWLGSIPLIVLSIVIQPILLDPVFNDFRPLENAQLRQKLLDLASRAGIEGGRVYQVDKSKQTNTMNAYVNGIGPTARIVMWDTLLAKLDEDEVLAVMGHEMGHYVLKHIWKGLAFSLVLSFLVFFLGQRIHDRGLARWGWGIREKGDPASLPWLLLIMYGAYFVLSPVTNGFSRHIERQSDMFSLELTHLNEPMAIAFRKMAEDSKRDPSPHPLIEWWRYSHPPIAKRIPFALGYRPWERGEGNRVWGK
ncbi:MAG TPA: M48 family metallopeptidase [Thermoanaerobaculia bacterium]|nr:M48 family metallopeptidase [Thermoanaerobaculia bacterium]